MFIHLLNQMHQEQLSACESTVSRAFGNATLFGKGGRVRVGIDDASPSAAWTRASKAKVKRAKSRK